MPQKTLGPAYLSMMTAANDHYHALRSFNRYGAIKHAQALAQVLLDTGAASSQAEAVRKAADELEHTTRIAQGQMINRAAKQALDKEAQAEAAEQRKRLQETLVPLGLPA